MTKPLEAWAILAYTVRAGLPACRVGYLDGPNPGTCGVIGVGVEERVSMHELVNLGREAMAIGRPLMGEAGGRTFFADPVLSLPRLLILGGGHVAKDLVPAASAAGFAVTVVDDRPEFAAPERFTDAAVVCGEPVSSLDSLQPGRTDFVVIATRSHEGDLDALRAALKWPAAYVGMVGSQRKVLTLKQSLLDSNVTTEKALDQIRAPIGLDIGAETPAEIAVSIVAELIAVRRGGSGVPLSSASRLDRNRKAIPAGDRENAQVWAALSQALEDREPCALATILRVRGSAPRGAGAHMLVYTDGRAVGTIGGGRREAEVTRAAVASLTSRQALVYHADFSQEQGMLCGGTCDLLIEPLP